jgi:phenylalanyl-tRNA synthetase alpha chain
MQALRERFQKELSQVRSLRELQEIRARYLGRKGALTEALKGLKALPPEERRQQGRLLNELKASMEEALRQRQQALKEAELKEALTREALDITLPGHYGPPGRPHPVSTVLEEIVEVFLSMGFSVEEGPEVELDYYNFEALNIPRDHPARDMQDTFYVSDDVLLRTHTSPVQIRVMKQQRPPLRFIAPGKVYRCDADVSHTPMFHQVEGLMVAEDISFAHLKGTLEAFLHRLFGQDVPVRFRPSYFPFTEPSAEVDIGCIFCRGSGCRVCQGSGWIEILGAGMVHPRVFEMVGYEPERYSGFAFGMGVERIAMLRYQIEDIRLFFVNDARFLAQF